MGFLTLFTCLMIVLMSIKLAESNGLGERPVWKTKNILRHLRDEV